MENQEKSLTVGMYRGIDLTVFTFLACALEYINVFVFKNFFSGELYTLSIMLPVTLIVMVRWNYWAVVPAVLTGLAWCLANGAVNPASFAVYMIGNCFALLDVIWFKAVGKRRLGENVVLQVGYVFTGYVFVALGRALITLPFEGNIIGNIRTYMIAEEVSGVIGALIVIIAARQKGLFKDQLLYLKELAKEDEKNNR